MFLPSFIGCLSTQPISFPFEADVGKVNQNPKWPSTDYKNNRASDVRPSPYTRGKEESYLEWRCYILEQKLSF